MKCHQPRVKSLRLLSLSAIAACLLAAAPARATFTTTTEIQDGTSNTFFGDGSVKFKVGFDPAPTLDWRGRRVGAGGVIVCTEGERVEVRVAFTQRTTGAVAEGLWRGECTGHAQTWVTEATARGVSAFASGAAQGSAVAVTSSLGKATDTLQWLEDVTF